MKGKMKVVTVIMMILTMISKMFTYSESLARSYKPQIEIIEDM